MVKWLSYFHPSVIAIKRKAVAVKKLTLNLELAPLVETDGEGEGLPVSEALCGEADVPVIAASKPWEGPVLEADVAVVVEVTVSSELEDVDPGPEVELDGGGELDGGEDMDDVDGGDGSPGRTLEYMMG